MLSRCKVLCVDDHPETARCTAQLLEQAGCEVRICHDGPAALALAEQFDPDVCVLDLTMPGMQGDELATRLRQRAGVPPVRCIALTGHWDIGSQHRTHNVGFEQHLVKPVEPRCLVAAVLGVTAGM
jgi:CheY-like chemotaxis protein